MKRRRLSFGGRMCARQPPWNPCRPALFDRRMGKARYEGRLVGTDRPLPEATVPVLETLREHNPQLSQDNAGPPQVCFAPHGGGRGKARPLGRSGILGARFDLAQRPLHVQALQGVHRLAGRRLGA